HQPDPGAHQQNPCRPPRIYPTSAPNALPTLPATPAPNAPPSPPWEQTTSTSSNSPQLHKTGYPIFGAHFAPKVGRLAHPFLFFDHRWEEAVLKFSEKIPDLEIGAP